MLKKIFRAALVCASVSALCFVFPPHLLSASAENTNFQVNVQEILSVSIKTPASTSWASGEVGQFLRNKFNVKVVSNNANGFIAGMTAGNTSANLTHSSKNSLTLPTINGVSYYQCSSAQCTEFGNNVWGYSLDDGNNTGRYYPMNGSSSPPIPIFTSNDNIDNKDIYFGAKANISQASGTYSGTVVISVVTGTTSFPSPIPDPVEVTPDSPRQTPVYDSTANATAYTYVTTTGTAPNATTTTTTQVTPGYNTSAYNGYTPPQGTTETSSSNIYEGSMLTTVLATTAAVAAGTGITFFILAKRKKDDDEDEEETA